MKLSQFTDNALKILLYCASHSGQRITRKEICEFFDLSEEHLRKVVHQLSQQHYLTTYPGRYGGFELARPASEINIGEVISQTEHQITLFDCQGQQCRLLPSCSLNKILAGAQQAFFDYLANYSLEELVKDKKTYKLLLND